MADVFVSYAHEDVAFVRDLASALEAEGLSVWWDHSIPPGQTWDSHIARGINDAKAAIVVWSDHSVTSDWVKEEASLARAGGKYLPVQIGPADPPIGFSRIQAAQMAGWNGDRSHPQWRMLIGEVRRVMTGAVQPAHAPRRPAHDERQIEAPRKRAPFLTIGLALVLAAVIGLGGFYIYQLRMQIAALTPTQGIEASDAVATTAAPPERAVEAPSPFIGTWQGQFTLNFLGDPYTSGEGTWILLGDGTFRASWISTHLTRDRSTSENDTGTWFVQADQITMNGPDYEMVGTLSGRTISGIHSHRSGDYVIAGPFTLSKAQ